jgi:hypothetical protein
MDSEAGGSNQASRRHARPYTSRQNIRYPWITYISRPDLRIIAAQGTEKEGAGHFPACPQGERARHCRQSHGPMPAANESANNAWNACKKAVEDTGLEPVTFWLLEIGKKLGKTLDMQAYRH